MNADDIITIVQSYTDTVHGTYLRVFVDNQKAILGLQSRAGPTKSPASRSPAKRTSDKLS